MRSQVSAELLIVMAAVAALAIYVFTQMREAAGRMNEKYKTNVESKLDTLLEDISK